MDNGPMTDHGDTVGGLTEDELAVVLGPEWSAPQPGRVRPWSVHPTATTLELRTATGSPKPIREDLLACGAWLLTVRLAIGAIGRAGSVRILPDHTRDDLLAVITPMGRTSQNRSDQQLTAVAARERGGWNRDLRAQGPVEPIHPLQRAARQENAWLARLTPAITTLLGMSVAGADDSSADSGGPDLVVVGTFFDTRAAQLQAGHAIQRVLLTARAAGLPAVLLTGMLQDDRSRAGLRELLGGAIWPQAVIDLTPAGIATAHDFSTGGETITGGG